jgi:Gene product 88
MYLQTPDGELGLSEVEKLTPVARRCIAGPDSVRTEGEYFVAAAPNAFGLPSVETCPGSTAYCESMCYAIDSERRTATARRLAENLNILESAGTVDGMSQKLMNMLDRYRTRADRLGLTIAQRFFRIHWSGDFFSEEYAEAWRNVIQQHPDTNFYTYTRSFQPDTNVIPVLADLENLELFLSVDPQNVDRAAEVAPDFPNVRVGYLVKYLEEAEPLQTRMGRVAGFRTIACPENVRNESGKRKLSTISEDGGACARCMYCVRSLPSRDVVFLDSGNMFECSTQRLDMGVLDMPVVITRKADTVRSPSARSGALLTVQSALF